MYFGTVARYRCKPGHADHLLDEMKGFEENPPEGWIYTTTFQSVHDPNEFWISVVFESEEVYRKGADSPEMNRDYEALLEHLEGPPEWHDGNVVHEAMRKS